MSRLTRCDDVGNLDGYMVANADTDNSELHTLPPSLRIVLNRIHDDDQRRRFEEFFSSAAGAIQVLGELDLASYHIDRLGTMDLELWEALAPAVKDTLNAVNAFLRTVREHFPDSDPSDTVALEASLDDWFADDDDAGADPMMPTSPSAARDGGTAGESGNDQVREAERVLGAICAGLAQEVTHFGEGLRNPRVMGDRWKLLDYVAQFRGKFRAGIGETVFLAARVFVAVRRQDVVPFYREDTEDSVFLRFQITVTNRRIRLLQEGMNAHHGAAQRQEDLERILALIRNFMELPAYGLMREADKRALLQSKQDIAELCARGADTACGATAERAVEGLAKFFDSLNVMNRRELLIVHDRHAVNTLQRALRAARDALIRDDESKVRELLCTVVGQAQSLIGRDAELDDAALTLAYLNVESMDVAAMGAAVSLLYARLQNIPGL